MKAIVYVDGFNLYYGCLKKSSYKWLNLKKLCDLLFPHYKIEKIKYFTAPIKIRENDKDHDRPNRQQIYLRALKTIPEIEIIYGSFLSHTVLMKKADNSGYINVLKTEEKGTDVNIASHVINDGHKGLYEVAVIISNDSDLVEPVKIVTTELDLLVTVVSPYKKNSFELKKTASSVRQIREGVLGVSQFEKVLRDSVGEFRKPLSW